MNTWPIVASSRKSQGGGGGGEEGHGILEGISSLHSWIKSQTMIRPNKIVKKKVEDNYDDVSIQLKITKLAFSLMRLFVLEGVSDLSIRL